MARATASVASTLSRMKSHSLSPVHTQMDGDTLFALSTGDKECDFMRLSVLATEAVARAIANAGYLARERRT